jgi:hypothetical protein
LISITKLPIIKFGGFKREENSTSVSVSQRKYINKGDVIIDNNNSNSNNIISTITSFKAGIIKGVISQS